MCNCCSFECNNIRAATWGEIISFPNQFKSFFLKIVFKIQFDLLFKNSFESTCCPPIICLECPLCSNRINPKSAQANHSIKGFPIKHKASCSCSAGAHGACNIKHAFHYPFAKNKWNWRPVRMELIPKVRKLITPSRDFQ